MTNTKNEYYMPAVKSNFFFKRLAKKIVLQIEPAITDFESAT